ncbi:30400_t:CDS:2 [Racocetra persica]|uniref:30400_t:CDS:1 n=1 Tax=Racocetra persica TaxID=160502 RepID=A0ACA9PXS9_9GLOM|nr:30400_t:CDS:2 [Racocetra persica]
MGAKNKVNQAKIDQQKAKLEKELQELKEQLQNENDPIKKQELEQKTKAIEQQIQNLGNNSPNPPINPKEKEIIDRQEALKRAKNLSLDLFCVAPDKNPPVCKLINYQKYAFELSKKKKDKKENICKEVRISFNIGEKDLKDKLERVNKWTEKG